MTRARITTKVQRWSEGEIVPSFPSLRARYGDPIANAAEMAASMAEDARDQPSAQDIKRTLCFIQNSPMAVDLRRLDASTHCELVRQSYKIFSSYRLDRLSDDGLRACAAGALCEFKAVSGRPGTDWLATWLVGVIVEVRKDTPTQQLDAVISDVLEQARVASADPANVRRLRALAGAG